MRPLKPQTPHPNPSMLHRHFILQLDLQLREPPIRLHQASRRTNEPIRQLPHAAEKPILKHPLRLIHEIGHLNREAIHAGFIPSNGRDFGQNDRLVVFIMHVLQVLDARVAVGTVVVESEVIGRIGRDAMHKVLQPLLTILIIRHGRTDEFLPPLLSQRDHLIVPGLRGALRGDAVLVRLVEVVDDVFLGVEDVLPVRARELGFEVDHGAEGGAAFEFGRDPGVPVGDGGEGAVEVALVHGPGDAGVAGAGAVGPIPEETTLFDNHFERKCRV